jgi:hypothetical protein
MEPQTPQTGAGLLLSYALLPEDLLPDAPQPLRQPSLRPAPAPVTAAVAETEGVPPMVTSPMATFPLQQHLRDAQEPLRHKRPLLPNRRSFSACELTCPLRSSPQLKSL